MRISFLARLSCAKKCDPHLIGQQQYCKCLDKRSNGVTKKSRKAMTENCITCSCSPPSELSTNITTLLTSKVRQSGHYHLFKCFGSPEPDGIAGRWQKVVSVLLADYLCLWHTRLSRTSFRFAHQPRGLGQGQFTHIFCWLNGQSPQVDDLDQTRPSFALTGRFSPVVYHKGRSLFHAVVHVSVTVQKQHGLAEETWRTQVCDKHLIPQLAVQFGANYTCVHTCV